MTPQDKSESASKSVVERLLSVITEVHPGEGTRTLLLATNVFFLLFSYYLLKAVRDSLIITEGGAEIRAYSSAWQALVLMALVPAYAAVAASVNRMKLITYATLFFIGNLLLFAGLGYSGVREGVVFFIWVGVFNMLVISQFWAFANDLHTEGAGKRLFPAIMVGASIGATVGGQVAKQMFAALGAYGLMLLSAGLLLVCIAITRWIDSRATAVQRAAEFPLGDRGVLEILGKDRYLQLIALLMVMLNVVNTTGEYLLARFVEADAVRRAGADIAAQQVIVGQFYGDFASIYSALGLVLQFFFVSRIFRYAGVGGALLILPILALMGYSMILAVPILGVIRWVKIFENGTDYSIQNTARQALFLPTTREAKYKAKAAIDSFFVRAGDLMQAGIVYAGTNWFFLDIKGFAAVNLVLTLVWLGIALAIAREYRRRTQPSRAAAPPESATQGAIA